MTEPLTKQAILDAVYTGMKAQGRKSEDANGFGMYRSPDGLKCAVGMILSDDEYHPRMEGYNVYDLKLPERLEPFADLLIDLQDLHDGDLWIYGENLERSIGVLAKEHGLESPVLRASK